MKKLLTTVIAISLCLSAGLLLSSCEEGHTHSYKTEWTTDATHHWHECEGENCLIPADRAEHTWDEGEITTDATADKKGEKTFTCTVCSAERTEDVDFEGVTEEAWQESIAEQKFDNVTVNYSFKTTGSEQTHVVKFADGRVYRHMSISVPDSEPYTMEMTFTGDEAEVQKAMFLNIFLTLLAERDNFVYDAESNSYNAPDEVVATVSPAEGVSATETMTNGVVKFASNGLLEYFSCTLKEVITQNGEVQTETVGDAVWTFSDYGTTTVDEPAEQQ